MRLKNLIPTEAKLQLYKAAILLHLTYCHLTWHFCKASDRRKLERIQGRGLRTNFLGTRNYWQKQTYHRCTTDDQRTLLSSCMKLSITYCYRDFLMFFNQTVVRITRKRAFVQPLFFSVTYGKHSLCYLGPKLWNDLPPTIRSLPSLKQFKSVIGNQDLSALAANVSDCQGCKLCRE